MPAAAVVGGAAEQAVEVGLAAVGDPGLGAVDDVVVAVAHRAGDQRGGVRAGLRLGQAVAAEQLAADQVGQPARALLVGAELGQREAGQGVHADALGHRGPDGRELLDDLQVDLVGLAAAAVLLGVGQAEQAGLAQGAEHLAREPAVGLVRRGLRRELLAGQLAGQVEQRRGLLGRQVTVDGHRSARQHDVVAVGDVEPLDAVLGATRRCPRCARRARRAGRCPARSRTPCPARARSRCPSTM